MAALKLHAERSGWDRDNMSHKGQNVTLSFQICGLLTSDVDGKAGLREVIYCTNHSQSMSMAGGCGAVPWMS